MLKFATAAPVTAVVEIPAGRVRLHAADRSDTTVEVLPADPAKSRDAKAAERIAVTFADGVLRIESPAAENRILGDTGSVEVVVELPAGSRVEGRAAAAELRTEGRLGDVTFEGAYRRIALDETASLRLTATDGDVEVGRLDGPAEISTQRGAIRIAEAVRGTLVLSTQSGDITVGAAAGVSATLDAGTAYGRVGNALRNDGAPALDIRATTSNGDITARSL
ncbi:DUF4097 family beta strand repeat-containing protein [Streptomyces sp. NPDC048018]|uniref:DUF4097 family beta strand repeat-containing protein n=1 Tax=Streptomyces sp. NPDC048018 TaxID=3365499 RepID=UPI0037244A8B